ncbi:MAG: (Fe-S)-binding protein [Chloroflexi bacterium]|nr:(Fe-S)-binding protein [Chloroflexota bacterium]
MALPLRASPRGKKVSLFVTCIMDMVYPDVGLSVVDILEHLGVEVDFPEAQTCCGQPGYNSGYRAEARAVAEHFLRVFAEAEVIVTPSGSCAAMIRHEYPQLFAADRVWRAHADRAAACTWEFSEFIVAGLGITDLKLRLRQPQTFAFHDACHGLRLLGLGAEARALLTHVENASIEELKDADACCGFGGLFSVKMPEVSAAMLGKKLECIEACPAETIVTGDVSCMTQMNGGLSRHKSAKRVRHIAAVLGEALKHTKQPEPIDL